MNEMASGEINSYGEFSGDPLTRWIGFRDMLLEEALWYIDKKGKKWLVPRNAIVNGATIPRSLWSIVGSPFVGQYRRASVIHDYFVGEGNNPDVSYKKRRKADKMFFFACRTDGCSWKFAATLYIGVSVGSWSSIIGLKHSLTDFEMKSLSPIEDEEIKRKYFFIEGKAQDLINRDEDFSTLENLVNDEIEKEI